MKKAVANQPSFPRALDCLRANVLQLLFDRHDHHTGNIFYDDGVMQSCLATHFLKKEGPEIILKIKDPENIPGNIIYCLRVGPWPNLM